VALRSFDRIETIEQRLGEMKVRAKRRKQAISRDVSGSADELCRRISELLAEWRVPMVHAVHSMRAARTCTLITGSGVVRQGQTRHLSDPHGRGADGAASELGYSHIGLIAIDSPVVTYKDPKHGSQDPDEALDPSVKDRLYAWLADRKRPGHIIVLENEEPKPEVLARLGHTEFVGSGKADGRRGFFPLSSSIGADRIQTL